MERLTAEPMDQVPPAKPAPAKRAAKKFDFDEVEQNQEKNTNESDEAKKLLDGCDKATAITSLFVYGCPNKQAALNFITSFKSGDHMKAALSPIMQFLEAQTDFRVAKKPEALKIAAHCDKESIEQRARSVRSQFNPITPFNVGVLLANHPYLKSSGFQGEELIFKVSDNEFLVNMKHDEKHYEAALKLFKRFDGLQTHVVYEPLPWNEYYMQVCLFACTLFDVSCDDGVFKMERRPTADFHPSFKHHDLAMARKMLALVENIAENINGKTYKNYKDGNSCNVLYAVLSQWGAIVPDYADFTSTTLKSCLDKWNTDYGAAKLGQMTEIDIPTESQKMDEIIRVGTEGRDLDDHQCRTVKALLNADAKWTPTAGHTKNVASYNFYEINTMPLPKNRTGVLDFVRSITTIAKDTKESWDSVLIMGHGANHNADAFDTYNSENNGILYDPTNRRDHIPKIVLKSGTQYSLNNGVYMDWETNHKWPTLLQNLRSIAKPRASQKIRSLVYVREFQRSQDNARNLLDLIAAIDTTLFNIDLVVEYTMPDYSLLSQVYTQSKAKSYEVRALPSFLYDNDHMIMLFSENFKFTKMKETAKVAPLIGDRFMMAAYYIYSHHRKVALYASGLTDLWPRATLEEDIPDLHELDMQALCIAYTVKERNKTNITKKAVGIAARAGVELAAAMSKDILKARQLKDIAEAERKAKEHFEKNPVPPPTQTENVHPMPDVDITQYQDPNADPDAEIAVLVGDLLPHQRDQLAQMNMRYNPDTEGLSPEFRMSEAAQKRKKGEEEE